MTTTKTEAQAAKYSNYMARYEWKGEAVEKLILARDYAEASKIAYDDARKIARMPKGALMTVTFLD